MGCSRGGARRPDRTDRVSPRRTARRFTSGPAQRRLRNAKLSTLRPRPETRVLVAAALVLVLLGLFAFDGLDTATGSWLVLIGSVVALGALAVQLIRR